MISAFTNIFKIPELRQRVLFTLAMIVIIRAGSAITTPGVNAEILREWFRNVADAQSAGGVASLFNLFSGGALAHCAIFSLGIMPYISASIMMQLLTAVVPHLGKLAREDGGRRKIMQYTAVLDHRPVSVSGLFARTGPLRIRRLIPFYPESWIPLPVWDWIWSRSPV